MDDVIASLKTGFTNPNRLFYHDYRGSVTWMTNTSGQNIQTATDTYTPFGMAPNAPSGATNQPGFNGQEGSGGLVYMRNRWYDPNTGRFTQQDPIGFGGGINLYGYSGNDPVSYTDPYGLKVCITSNRKTDAEKQQEVDSLKSALADATDSDVTYDSDNCVTGFHPGANGNFRDIQARFGQLVRSQAVYGLRFGENSEAWSSAFRGTTAIILRGDFTHGWYNTGGAISCALWGGHYGGPFTVGAIVAHELIGHGTVGGDQSAAIGVENGYHRGRHQSSRCGGDGQ